LIRDTWNEETQQSGLFVVESVDSLILAKTLDNALLTQINLTKTPHHQQQQQQQQEGGGGEKPRLMIFVQVNTSGEQCKCAQTEIPLIKNLNTHKRTIVVHFLIHLITF
jgi:hypothetical protein